MDEFADLDYRLSQRIATKTREVRKYLCLSALALVVGAGCAFALAGFVPSNTVPQGSEFNATAIQPVNDYQEHQLRNMRGFKITNMERFNGE